MIYVPNKGVLVLVKKQNSVASTGEVFTSSTIFTRFDIILCLERVFVNETLVPSVAIGRDLLDHFPLLVRSLGFRNLRYFESVLHSGLRDHFTTGAYKTHVILLIEKNSLHYFNWKERNDVASYFSNYVHNFRTLTGKRTGSESLYLQNEVDFRV